MVLPNLLYIRFVAREEEKALSAADDKQYLSMAHLNVL
jgi:hypothetical protein